MPRYLFFCLIITALWWGSGKQVSCACQDRAKSSSIKANMHTFQTALETYAVDWGGRYPQNVQELFKESTRYKYWKDFQNPIDATSGYGSAYIDHRELLIRLKQEKQERERQRKAVIQLPAVIMGIQVREIKDENDGFLPGIVIYDVNADQATYYIYSMNPDGQWMTDRGQPFVLTNAR